MKFNFLILSIIGCIIFSCKEEKKTVVIKNEPIELQSKGHKLVFNAVKKIGDYSKLSAKKDVVYTYTYRTPDGKTDISTEKYIFKDELSYGIYKRHERTFPDLKGVIEQGYNGDEFWLKHNGEIINDEDRLKRVAFNRPTNFYWFAMFQKLLDPGVKYEYIGSKVGERKVYDVVDVSFNSVNGKPTDIYRLYIDKDTSAIDQFLFTVADFGLMKKPFLMRVEYEKIDNLLIPTKRKYKKSNWDGDVNADKWITVNWTDIKFDNNLRKESFNK